MRRFVVQRDAENFDSLRFKRLVRIAQTARLLFGAARRVVFRNTTDAPPRKLES